MAQYHVGRLIDHVHLRVADLDTSQRFYRAVLTALGRGGLLQEGDGWFQADELYVDRADGPVSHVHLAFQADSAASASGFSRDPVLPITPGPHVPRSRR